VYQRNPHQALTGAAAPTNRQGPSLPGAAWWPPAETGIMPFYEKEDA
jgi:hypothetical protein